MIHYNFNWYFVYYPNQTEIRNKDLNTSNLSKYSKIGDLKQTEIQISLPLPLPTSLSLPPSLPLSLPIYLPPSTHPSLPHSLHASLPLYPTSLPYSFLHLFRELLLHFSSCSEEGTRNVVSECLGTLCLAQPSLLSRLVDYLPNSSALEKSTIVTSVKFTISDQVCGVH